MQVIESSTNAFGGVLPKPAALPQDPETFRQQLSHSMDAWKRDGFLVAWLEVPITKASLIPVAVDAGFVFHHSSDDYLMLTCRLVEDAFIPVHATHYIGAGGVVLNDKQELLVVCEKYRGAGRPPYYKLPGGALHPGEHLVEGVVREVFEETGVPTRFDTLVCLRHWHGYRYGKSDIYFVCRLVPLHQDIAMQLSEIEECRWMPVEEYFNAETVSSFNKHIVRTAMTSPGFMPTWIEGYADPKKYEFFMPVDGERQDQ